MFWTSLERRTSRTNKDTVSHPPHGHDDIATSVAGVSVNALDSTLNTVVVESLWDVFARSRQDRQIDDKEENFRLAEEADRRGELRPRDRMWLLAERERRRRAGR